MEKKIIFSISLILLIVIYFSISLTIGDEKFRGLKNVLTLEQKNIIKKYIFPYEQISLLEKKIVEQKKKNKDVSSLYL